MTGGERMWLWAQPLLAILAGLAGVAAWVVQALGAFVFLPSVQAVITGTFVLPGLAVSLGVNHLIVMARRPPMLTSGEKILLGVQGLLVVITVLTSLDPAALIAGYLLWPLMIAAAVTACVTMTRTTLSMRHGGYSPASAAAEVSSAP